MYINKLIECNAVFIDATSSDYKKLLFRYNKFLNLIYVKLDSKLQSKDIGYASNLIFPKLDFKRTRNDSDLI